MLPWTRRNYSHSYRGGRRGHDDTICFETGYFGFEINKDDLTSIPFKIFGDDAKRTSEGHMTYTEVLKEENRARMEHDLVKESLTIELQLNSNEDEHASKLYRVVSGSEKPRLWEAGKICQHYDFGGLKFDQEGLEDMLHCSLNVVVWPNSLTFAIDVRYTYDEQGGGGGGPPSPFQGGIRVKMAFKNWRVDETLSAPNGYFYIDDDHDNRDNERKKYSAALACDLSGKQKAMSDPRSGVKIAVQINPPLPNDFQTGFNERFNCFLLHNKKGELFRFFQAGFYDIREYDDFRITVQNPMNDDAYVPVLLIVSPLANPTGLCPQICDESGKPTGIPVQLSKNWTLMRNYGRFYCLLPVKAMEPTTTYRVRIVYGFYGSLPSASHANLSLIGDHGHGTRWEQLAIGSWGETYCMDVDMGIRANMITDLRMLMTKGVDDKKWMWSDAGWGGDWLKLARRTDGENRRYFPYQWKCAYNSHGPCLTDVQYAGFYGPKVVSVNATVRTLRCDDFARTFSHVSYRFNENVPFKKASFFELGTANYICTPKIAFGNLSGLMEEMQVPDGLKHEAYFIENKILQGEGPWWFGFPGQRQFDNHTWGKGWRGLIIRSYSGSFGGEEYRNPSFSLMHHHRLRDNRPNLAFILNPPEGLTTFEIGDHVTFDVEVVTFPRKSTDYYGPNDSFRRHLESHPDSWTTVYREARGNNITVQILAGGSLQSNYPIVILSDESSDSIEFEVIGGLGAVPVRFDGMKVANGYELNRVDDYGDIIDAGSLRKEQEVHGSDFYQVEFDPSTNTYSHAFNIVLDELSASRWIICKNTEALIH